MMGKYSGTVLMWYQQYDNMNEWCPDVQMVRLAASSLKGPTRRLQECSHPARWIPLLHASNEHIIDYHPPDQAPGIVDTGFQYHASKKYFDVVTSSLSSAWCACVLLMMPLHVPMSGQDPPLPPPVCEDPRRKNLRSIRGASSNGKWFGKGCLIFLLLNQLWTYQSCGFPIVFSRAAVSFANCSTTSDIKDLFWLKD